MITKQDRKMFKLMIAIAVSFWAVAVLAQWVGEHVL
jgi:hypothetical protein